jgi:hypothetical protein
LKGRASTFSHDREEAKTNHYYSTTARERKSAPYSADKYERELEEQKQQEYDEYDTSEDNEADARDQA